MITQNFRRELEKEYPYARQCMYCKADPKNPSWEGLKEKVFNCNNCMADIGCKGNWTSDGMGFLAALYKKDSKNPIWEKIEKILRMS